MNGSIKRVTRFLIETLSRTEKTELVLFHINATYRKSSIWSESTWSTPEETAVTVFEAARQHTDALGGLQRFILNAYDRSDPEAQGDQPLGSVAFKVEPPMATDTEDAGSEPATGQGMLAMLMRHNQEMHRQSNHAMGTLTYHLAKTVEKQADQIDKLMADRIATIDVMEELMSQKHDRDLAARHTEAKIERDKSMFEKAMQLGPVVLNKLAGKELVRQKDTILESVVMEFMNTIKPGHLDRLADSGLLDRQQMILFTTMLEQVTKRMVALSDKAESSQSARSAAINTHDESKLATP